MSGQQENTASAHRGEGESEVCVSSGGYKYRGNSAMWLTARMFRAKEMLIGSVQFDYANNSVNTACWMYLSLGPVLHVLSIL